MATTIGCLNASVVSSEELNTAAIMKCVQSTYSLQVFAQVLPLQDSGQYHTVLPCE